MADVSIAKKLNINCRRGDTFLMKFDFFEDCNQDTPLDLFQMSATFKCEVRDGEDDTDPIILTFDTGDFTISGSPDNNELIMQKADADMVVAAGDYYYDMEMTNGKNAAKATIFYGDFIIKQDITTQV